MISLRFREITQESQSQLGVGPEEGCEPFVEVAFEIVPKTLPQAVEKVSLYPVCASPVEYLVQDHRPPQIAEHIAEVVRAGPMRGNDDDLMQFGSRDDLACQRGKPEGSRTK